jgi:hypothetical protein
MEEATLRGENHRHEGLLCFCRKIQEKQPAGTVAAGLEFQS